MTTSCCVNVLHIKRKPNDLSETFGCAIAVMLVLWEVGSRTIFQTVTVHRVRKIILERPVLEKARYVNCLSNPLLNKNDTFR